MTKNSSGKYVFRRVNGRIIPILAKASAAGAISAGTGLKLSKDKLSKENKSPNKLLQAAAIGASIGSAFISAFPIKKLGFFGSQAASLGVDAIGTSLNAASVSKMSGSKKKKVKEFAKAEIRSAAIGYGAWGAMLLKNQNVRANIFKVTRKATRIVRGSF